MRKIISFLALLVIAFALPHRAVAWNFSGNTDPSAINLYLDDPIKQSVPMTFANSQWTAEFTATKDDHPFKINIPSNNAWYGYDNGKVSANATGWTEIWTNSNTGKFHFTDLTAGVTYKVTLTGKSNVSCNMKIEPATQQATSWDFRTNTKPTAVTIHMKQDNVDHELTFSSGVWSGTFVISSAESNGYVNYYINATDDAGSITKFGNDKGTSDLGAWSSVTSCNDAYSKENYQGGITAGKKYKVEVTSDATNEYKVRFTEAAVAPWDFRTNTKPTAVTMHMKQDNVDHELTFSSGVWSGTFVINSAESNGYVNYYINATDDAGSITKFGNDKGTSDLGAWSSVTSCNDAYSKESYQGNITAGKKYKVEVTADDVNQYKVRFTEAVAAPWDFSGNTRPSSVKATSVTGADATELTFNYDGTQQEYKWISPKFKATAASIAFKLELKDGSETLILGKDITGDLGSEVAGTTSDGNSGTYKEGNLTVGKYYQIEIAAIENNVFKYKVVEVTPDPVPYPTLYMYDTTPKQIASATSDNGIYTFNYKFNGATMFLLSTTGGLTEWDGVNGLNNDRYSPSSDVDLPGSSSFDKSDKNGKIWKVSAGNLGDYTITVDWNAKKLTAAKTVATSWDFSGNSKPSSVRATSLTGASSTSLNFTYDNALDTYKWVSQKFKATATDIAFKVEVSDGTETLTLGKAVGGALGSETACTTSDGNDGSYTQSGLTIGSYYQIEIAGTGDNAFKYKVVEVTAPETTFYIYNNSPWATKIQTCTTTGGVYEFSRYFSKNEKFVISTKDATGGYNDLKNEIYTHSTGETILVNGEASTFSNTNDGCWTIGEAGNYTIRIDWEAKTLTATWEVEVPNVNLPLTSLDFEGGKKHYFLVGERQGEWHLQPEWEFTVVEDNVNGDKLVLNNRFIYDGTFAIGVVDNYADYAYQKYTYYSANPDGETWDFSSSVLQCEDDFSGNARKMEDGVGITRDPGKVFAAKFDGDYWNGKGTFMSEIKVTLNADKLPSQLYFTQGTTKEANKNRVFTLVGSDIYNQYYNSSTSAGNTPMWDKSASEISKKGTLGWAEGWIQYDPNTNKPYVDANGEFLYHTSFTPDYLDSHPVQFNQKLTDGEFSYTSKEAQFVEWSNLSNLDSDPYKSFYEAFSSTETISNANGATPKVGENYNFTYDVICNNPDQTPSADWDCFVVRDMWVAGQIKFWAGWGGNVDWTNGGTGGIATWYGPNGGPDLAVGACQQVSGYDINSQQNVQLYKNGRNISDANYVISDGTPVYFNRVVLWYNVVDGVAKSYIQFIQESAGPAIFAQVTHNDTDDKDNYITYNWYLNATQNAADADRQVVGYEITRYRIDNGVEVFDGYPEGGYVDISDKNVTVADLFKGNSQTFTTVLDKGIGDLGFDPGLYRYKIIVTYDTADGAKKNATSNTVAIYSDELISPQPMALQIVELKDEGKTALGTTKGYLTYNPNDNATFYLLNIAQDSEDKSYYPTDVEEVEAATALNFLNNNPDKYLWTSDYYLRALDVDLYNSTMQGQKDAGLVTEIGTPSVTVSEKIGTKEIAHGSAHTLPFNGKNYLSMIMKRAGNLAESIVTVALNYSYKNAESAEVPVSTTGTTRLDPVLPQPYGLTYSYDYSCADDAVTYDGKNWVKVTVPSGHWNTGSTTTPKDVYVQLDDEFHFHTDRLDLNVKFNRPNVVEEIYNKYDIVYGVSLGVKGASSSDLSFTAVDKKTTDNGNPYAITVNGVRPNNEDKPVFNFATTTYEPNATAKADYSELGRNNGTFGAAPSIATEHTITVNSGTGFAELYLGKIEREGSTYDWMYKGHKNFKDAADQLDGSNDNTLCFTGRETIEPLYYLVELKDGSNSNHGTTYEYLVPHIADHYHGTDYKLDNSYKYLLDDDDPLIGTYVAKDFSDATPTLYATAMYLFEQKYEAVSEVAEGYNTVTIDSPAATLRRVNTAPGANPAAGNFGDLPDTGVAPTEAVEDKTAAYVAVAGATYFMTPGDKMVTGVEDVLADGEGAEAVYYNLQGVRVDNPASAGVYIRVQGKNVSKVVVK